MGCAEGQIKLLKDLMAAKLNTVTSTTELENDTNSTQLDSSTSNNQIVDGIAIAPCTVTDELTELIRQVVEIAEIPVVTFDTEIPDALVSGHVGTDNAFMGITMAQVMKQLRPEGGTFARVVNEGDNVRVRSDAFRAEMIRNNERDGQARWYEVPESPLALSGSPIWQMENVTQYDPTGIAVFFQTPMRSVNWTDWIETVVRPQDITVVGSDGSDYQIDYLNRRYVDGLVGQLPYDFGAVSADILLDIQYRKDGKLLQYFHPTNLVSYTLIPLELPEIDLDQNLLGGLVYIGYTAVAIIVLFALGCIAWTIKYRQDFVVRAAQPFFLIMVATGAIIMSSSLIPLSFDDGGEIDTLSESDRVAMCMSIPWLAFLGFTITFSALFSKTWRVNRLFKTSTHHQRLQVKVKDVLAPFVILLTTNVVILAFWTATEPLKYSRMEHDGTDFWNRVISTYGTCRSEKAPPYLTTLVAVNFLLVAVAVWQAFQARGIHSEFAEAKFIGLAVGSICQTFLTGVPLLVIVWDQPQAFYVVLCLMVFLLCMVVLVLIFVPKYFKRKEYSAMSEVEQRRAISEGIRKSNMPVRDGDTVVGSSVPLQQNNGRILQPIKDEGVITTTPDIVPIAKSEPGNGGDAVAETLSTGIP